MILIKKINLYKYINKILDKEHVEHNNKLIL